MSAERPLTFLEAREAALGFHEEVTGEATLVADAAVERRVHVIRRDDRWIARVRIEVDLGPIAGPGSAGRGS